jgi:hypothetical protein
MEGRLHCRIDGERTHRIIRKAKRLSLCRIGPDADDAHHAPGMALRAAMGEEQLPMAACAAAHQMNGPGLEAGGEQLAAVGFD